MEVTDKNIAAQIARHLLQIKAIKLSPQNPFTWASGMQSPIYCDNRIILSYPSIRKEVIQGLAQMAGKYEFDKIAGVATAGIAHGALLAEKLDQPFIYVRSKAKAHGRQNLIEGEVKGNEKVLVVEDLISTGGSSIKAVEAVRAAGCEVVGVLAIFTYGFDKAKDAFDQANCPFETLTNYTTLINEALSSDYINELDSALLIKWRKNPNDWQ